MSNAVELQQELQKQAEFLRSPVSAKGKKPAPTEAQKKSVDVLKQSNSSHKRKSSLSRSISHQKILTQGKDAL